MSPVPICTDEVERLASLAEYGLCAGDGQAEVGPLLQLASRVFDVPTVLLSLVEEHRQIFAARIGLDVCETDRSVSFCAHALRGTDVFFIPDATLDARFCNNPLVTGAPNIRFYAGQPLVAPTGFVLGTLCLIDGRPRSVFSECDRAHLKCLADLVLEKIEVRRLDRARRDGQDRFERVSATSPDGIVCADHEGRITFWNVAAEHLFGYTPQQALGRSIELIVPDRHRRDHCSGLHRVASRGATHLVGTTVELPARRRDGSELQIELSLSMWTEDGSASFGAIIRDVSGRRANEERLYRLAHLDALTGLPNRMMLRGRLDDVVTGDAPAALIAVNLDGFKEVNDTLGHSTGDRLLQLVAERILACAGVNDVVARLGADEFALVLTGTNDPITSAAMADRVIASLSELFEIDGEQISIAASAGVALYPIDGAQAEDLLASADLALYQAKSEGRHCRRFFTAGLRQAAVSKRNQEGELRAAVARGELELFYQPQVRAADGVLVGAEALLRWRHPERGLVSPAAFLPALESGRLAGQVGEWVIRSACEQASLWRREGLGDFRVGVNLFGAQFRTGDLSAIVRDALADHGLPAKALELEITENIILRHDDAMTGPLRSLRDDGVGVAFDDYGTGYASLSLLKRYPLTRLKVDQSFVRRICDDSEDAAIVRAVILLGRSFGLDVIAEGVETQAQQALLIREGCHELQGFLFGRPVSAEAFEKTWAHPTDLTRSA